MRRHLNRIRIIVAFGAMCFVSHAAACTTELWLGGTTGDVVAGDPTVGVARVSGFCGLDVSGLGDVKDDHPESDALFKGRFYFLPMTDTGAVMDLFVAYSDSPGTSELFSVSWDGANVILDASAAGGTSSAIAADPSLWILVEFSWESGGSGELWVNSNALTDPASDTFSPGSGAVESVRLGAPNGFNGLTGFITYDSYESRRLTAIGPELICDANGDGSFSLSDILAVINEKYGSPPTLAPGQPDCDLDGDVDLSDILATIEVVYPSE